MNSVRPGALWAHSPRESVFGNYRTPEISSETEKIIHPRERDNNSQVIGFPPWHNIAIALIDPCGFEC
jgi:hypothetical protein